MRLFMNFKTVCTAAIAAVGITAAANHATANTIAPNMIWEVGVSGDTMNVDPFAMGLGEFTPNNKDTGGSWTLTNWNGGNPNWMVESIAVDWDADPFINVAVTIVNTSGVDNNFVITNSTLSSDTIASPTIQGGTDFDLADITPNSIDAVLDTNTATSGDLYNAFIVATDVKSLIPAGDPGLPVTASFPAPLGNIADGYGPEASIAPLAAGDAFGIRHEFFLTAGDRVTINSTFLITPEPSSLALLSLGGLALIRRR